MKLERQQILALYMKVMKRFYKYLSGIATKDTLPTVSRLKDVSELIRYSDVVKLLCLYFTFSLFIFIFQIALEPHPVSVDDDLNNAAKQVEVGDVFGYWYFVYTTELEIRYSRVYKYRRR